MCVFVCVCIYSFILLIPALFVCVCVPSIPLSNDHIWHTPSIPPYLLHPHRTLYPSTPSILLLPALCACVKEKEREWKRGENRRSIWRVAQIERPLSSSSSPCVCVCERERERVRERERESPLDLEGSTNWKAFILIYSWPLPMTWLVHSWHLRMTYSLIRDICVHSWQLCDIYWNLHMTHSFSCDIYVCRTHSLQMSHPFVTSTFIRDIYIHSCIYVHLWHLRTSTGICKWLIHSSTFIRDIYVHSCIYVHSWLVRNIYWNLQMTHSFVTSTFIRDIYVWRTHSFVTSTRHTDVLIHCKWLIRSWHLRSFVTFTFIRDIYVHSWHLRMTYSFIRDIYVTYWCDTN